MKQFWATFCKDLKILGRDRAGLLVLFLMPAVLVLVVSLVQNNVLETTGASGLRVLFVNDDDGVQARKVRERLADIEALQLLESVGGKPLDETTARKLVAEGEYQFGIYLPEGTSRLLQERARILAREILSTEKRASNPDPINLVPLVVFFDPTVQGIFRTAVTSSLNQVLLGIEVEEKGKELTRALNTAFAARSGGFMGGGSLLGEDDLRRVLGEENLLTVQQESAAAFGPERSLPNAVQQNVPAWALFGMFFIVVPLSGALLRERQEGTLLRLRTLPVSYSVILSGKIAAFASVCLVQFTLMLAVGQWLLPLFGTPQLDLNDRLVPAYALAICAALAATGFGLLVGTAARSYEQASMFGAVSVVVAAAIGGVMVPVYVMPHSMQAMSSFSPLAWGLDGFLEIFVRGGNLLAVTHNLFSLLAFFAVSLMFALILFARENRLGR